MTDFPKEIIAIARRVLAEGKDWPVDPSRTEWAKSVLAAAEPEPKPEPAQVRA